MQEIPLADVPSQVLTVTLSNQPCRIKIYQNATGLYCNLYVNNVLLIGGVICENLNRLVRSAYLGFIGDLLFFDTQGGADGTGGTDPTTPGLGTQYKLLYYTPAELA